MLERMPQRDLLLALATLGVSAAIYWDSFRIKSIAQQDALGSAWVPRATALILAGLATILLVRALLRWRSTAVEPVDPTILAPEGVPQVRLVWLTLAASVLYAASLELRVDYTVSTFVYLMLLFALLAGIGRRALAIGAVVAAIMAFGCAYIFTKVFLVDLP